MKQQQLDQLALSFARKRERLDKIQHAASSSQDWKGMRAEWNGMLAGPPLLEVLPEGTAYIDYTDSLCESSFEMRAGSACGSPRESAWSRRQWSIESARSSAAFSRVSSGAWTPGGCAKRAYSPFRASQCGRDDDASESSTPPPCSLPSKAAAAEPVCVWKASAGCEMPYGGDELIASGDCKGFEQQPCLEGHISCQNAVESSVLAATQLTVAQLGSTTCTVAEGNSLPSARPISSKEQPGDALKVCSADVLLSGLSQAQHAVALSSPAALTAPATASKAWRWPDLMSWLEEDTSDGPKSGGKAANRSRGAGIVVNLPCCNRAR